MFITLFKIFADYFTIWGATAFQSNKKHCCNISGVWRRQLQGLPHCVLIILYVYASVVMYYDFVCFQASIFVQSHVRAHVELMWLLSSSTPIGWLNRMIQFKEKSRKAVRHLLYDSFHHQILFEKLNMLWEGTRNIDVSFIVNIFFFVIQTPAEIMNDMQLFLQFKMLSNNMHMSTSY